MSQADRPALGLRERKKAKTKAAIQQHALRLFREQGYEATTVEQIAAAVEVSPSTFFRYFATKEDVVLWDDFDPLLIAAYDAQPADLGPIAALRGAILDVVTKSPPDVIAQQWERGALFFAVPELRMRMLDQFGDAGDLLARLVAKRAGNQPDEFAVRMFAGAILGVMFAALYAGIDKPMSEYVGLIDASLAYLEAGLPL